MGKSKFITALENHTKTKMEELTIENLTEKEFDARSMSGFILPSVRYEINLGYEDETDKDEILEFIAEGSKQKKDAVQNIAIGKNSTVIEVEKYSDGFLTALNGKPYGEKTIEIKRYVHSEPKVQKREHSRQNTNQPKSRTQFIPQKRQGKAVRGRDGRRSK